MTNVPYAQVPRPSAYNEIAEVTVIGGILGLFSTPRLRLVDTINDANRRGLRVVQILPSGGRNIITYILRLLILVLTLFFYTTGDGWYVVLERR